MSNPHFRRIAGNLEFFVGAYLVTFGSLAAVYFERTRRPSNVPFALVGALIGMLLIFRAGRLLGWRPWIYWTVVLISIVVPIAWLGRSLI
jgi:hypothetical protein